MKRMKQGLAAALSLCLLCTLVFTGASLPLASAATTGNPLTESDFLRVEGTDLVNQRGEVVILRGVNLGGWMIQENWMCPIKGEDGGWANLDTLEVLESRFTEEQVQTLFDTYQDNWITENDLNIIANTGANVVRVPFWYRNFMKDAEGTWITENPDENPGFKRLDWIIEQAGERGMYVILDMHGCPGGQSLNHSSGTLNKNELYSNETYQNTMKELWVAIASRYKDEPAVAAYDIMNEPQNNEQKWEYDNYYNPWLEESWELSNEIYEKMVAAVREVDTRHVITVEGIWSASNLPDPAALGWYNMMYQIHVYTDNLTSFERSLKVLYESMKKYGVAGYVGEFSNMDAFSVVEKYGISWTLWSYKGGTGNWGNWFWYWSNVTRVDPYTDSYDTILQKWGVRLRTVSFTRNNTPITNVQNTCESNRVTVDEGWTRYQAEDTTYATVVNSDAQKEDAPDGFERQEFFSGRLAAGGLSSSTPIAQVASDWSNIKYVRYVIDVEKAGDYQMRLAYNGDDDKTILLKVNGQQQTLDLPQMGDGVWNVMHVKTVPVTLKAGVNEIWISGVVGSSSSWLNIDYIELNISARTVPVTETGLSADRYEAEDAEVFPASQGSVSSGSQYSGGQAVGGLVNAQNKAAAYEVGNDWSSLQGLQFTVEAPQADTYDITIAYSGNADKAVLVRAGEGRNEVVYLPLLRNAPDTVVQYKTVQLELAEGTNTIYVSGGFGGDTVIDYIDVTCVNPVHSGRLLGDVNGDGTVNSKDARLVLQFSVGAITLTDEEQAAANVNADSAINSKDARIILQTAVS